MRIAIFSDNFYPELSGISDSTIVLARELAQMGHFVDFYVPRYSKADYGMVNAPFSEIDLGKNIRVIRFWSFPYGTGTGQGRFVFPTGFRVLGLLRSRPDVVHTQLFFGVGLEAIFAARILRKPVIGTNHTALKQFLRYSPVRLSLIDFVMLRYMNWYYERCELVTAPARSIITEMEAVGFSMAPKKMGARVMPNPIVIPEPGTSAERAETRKKFGLSGPVIVYAGRFAKEKSVDVLLEAVAIAKRSMPGIMLALAGNGAVKGELVELSKKLRIEDSVRFVGVLAKPELLKLYQAGDICATASTSEVQSITMLEAMAAGLPVVGVDVPGLSEHINAGNGRLARPNDPESLANEMVKLLQDTALRQRLGAGAAVFARQFSAERIALEWEQIYAGVIQSYCTRVKGRFSTRKPE